MARSASARGLRVGLLASHPIQYLSPLLKRLAELCELRVYYAHRQTAEDQAAAGYGVAFDWDADLLSGYQHRFLRNQAPNPTVSRFEGCDCPELPEIIAERALDAFIVTGWYLLAHLQAVTACRRLGVPVLVRGDSHLQTPRSMLKRVTKELVTRVIVGQFDAFLTVGQRNRAYLEHYGAEPRRIFTVPHFVDGTFFAERSRCSADDRAAMRSGFGIHRDAFVVLFVGRFAAFKRPLDLVRAAGSLRDRVARLELVFVGAGELEPEIRRQAGERNVRAHFLGFRNQSELPRIYAISDLLVLPSDSETWGIVVNEAFACGVPAVVSDAVGSVPDLIVEHRTGFSYPCGDVGRLADAIASMSLMRGRNGLRSDLEAVNRKHSCEVAAAGTLEAVEFVARRGEGAS